MLDRRTRTVRRVLRAAGWLLLRLLARPTITGRVQVLAPGPVIYAANHASTFDALLLFVLLPRDTVFVGPGDFPLLWPGNWVVRHAGLILMKRGAVDREGLRQMLAHLQGGGRLGIFPEGGTWEKPIDHVKSGAAYLSQAAGARIVPMAFGGTYQVWRRMFLLRFPRVTVTIGPSLPPVPASGDRQQRQADLEAASVGLMRQIYMMLPPTTQAHYDRQARLEFRGEMLFRPNSLALPAGISLDALAELVAKPNLFSPLHRNARLPVRPFVRQGCFVRPRAMKRAADALAGAFDGGDFSGYLEYRLGEAKAAEIRAALAVISAAMDDAEAARVRVAFRPQALERAPHQDAAFL